MNLSAEPAPRIWDVVDALFDMGDVHGATLAQRFAVPTLDHLIVAATSDSVKNLYGTKKVDGEDIIDIFNRSITTGVREYALLSTYTRSIGRASCRERVFQYV